MRQFIAKKWRRANRRLKIIALPFLLIGLATAASLVFAYEPNDNKTGLVLDIDFSQDNYNSGSRTFTDKSGSGNNAVSTNQATFTTGKNGTSNGAMSLTSTNDEVVVPHNSSYKTSSITVSFLYKPQNTGRRHVIFTSWNGFTTEINSDRTFKWGLYGLSNQYFGTKQVNWDEWIHITGTFDNNSKQQCIYFNGVRQECQTVTGSISYGTGSLYLSGAWDWISGDFESAKIYDHALSETEIKDLYNNTKPKAQISSLEKGLVAYFPMDGENFNASNNKLTDKSAYSNHATNGGGILTTDRFDKTNGAMNFGNSASREYTSSYISSISYNLTMSAWIKPSAYPSERGTIILGSGAYYLSLYADGSIHTYWYGRTPSGYHSSLTGTAPIGEWTQVAAVWRNNSVDLYVNGVLKNTVVVNNATGTNSNSLILGAESLGRQYTGAMSDARVYNRALSNEEIEQLYTNYKPKTSASSLNKGLILDMPLTSKYTKSETAGSEIMTDNTPYSRDGQNYGATISNDANFIGGSTYIEHSAIAINKNNSWSFSMWQYKPSGSETMWQGFIGDTMADNGGYWMFHPSLSWYQDYYDNGTGAQAYGSMYTSVNLGDEIPYDEWYMLTVTYNGSNYGLSIYVNGDLKTSPTATWSPRPVSKFTFKTIGRGGGNRYFEGKISDVKIYNRILSDIEVQSLYDQGRGKSGTILNGLQ